jgi:hypothetical protein
MLIKKKIFAMSKISNKIKIISVLPKVSGEEL